MTLADGVKSEDKEQRWKDEDVDLTASASVGEDLVVELKLSPDECQEELQFFLFRGDLLMPSDRYEIRTRGNVVQLTLKESQKDDAGHYALVAKKLSTGLSMTGDERSESRRKIRLSIQDPSQGFDEGEPPIFVRRLSDLAVKVGTRTRFLVEIRSSTSPKITWHKNDEPVQSGSRFSFVHEGNFYCVDVAPVMVDDQGHWTCMAENGGGRSSCTSVLTVIVPKAYKKPEFVEELRALLTETGTVSLECKVVGVPTPVLKWFKDQKEIKAGDVFALTANPDDPTSLGTYTCEAVNCMGTACSSSKIHVAGKGSREGSLKAADVLRPSGPLPIFKRILCEESCRIGDSLTLSCQVTVPPWPKTITWYNKEGIVKPSEKYHIIEDGLGGYSIEIKGVETMDEGEWKCVATSSENMEQLSTCYVAMSIPKNYRVPRFMESLKAVLTDEGLVSFECKVVGFPTPLLRWFKDGQELHPGDVYQLTGTNSLGSYCCIARNCMGEAKSTAELTVEDIQNQLNEEERILLMSSNQAPKFTKGLRSCEARINDDFTFTIQVSVSPEPSLSWYRDDVPIIESEKYRLAREALGECHLEVRKLEFVDQAEWKCVAANDFGHSVTSCFLKLVIPKHFKKPKFLESLRAILSDEGAVNLECKVIGVPQPVLKWYKDGVELKPGDIHRIISGQDGTCCLGTYTCEATNCMGSVSSSASLLGFEDRLSVRKEESKEPIPLHELARNLSLSTIQEERTSQLYDTPQTDHSVTLDDRGEISFSFDGKEVSVSLYETPDLTEEEALQIVEMYADQLSEHITEGNVIELPPMRFTKETSKTRNLLMEAVVIDVPPDYFIADDEADDLRTEADVEDVSIMEDQMLSLQSSSYVSSPIADLPGDPLASGSPPSRPPRRKESKESPSSRSERSDKSLPKAFDWSESYHSAKEPSMNTQSSVAGQDDSGEAFTDALSFSGASRSKAEGFNDVIAAYVEETVEKIPLDEINYEETIEPTEEFSVQEIPVKRKKKKKDKQMGKGSRTPSVSSKASSEESYSMEPEERVKRRGSKSGREKGNRRGSTSSNKSVGGGRQSRSSSLSKKMESGEPTGQRRKGSDATIMVEDVRIEQDVRREQAEDIGRTKVTEDVQVAHVEENRGLVEERPDSATSVASTIESDKSGSKTNKERLLDNIYKLSEPIMTLRSALIDLDSLLPLLQTDGTPTNVENSQMEIARRIVMPVEDLCEQVSAIENKALKSAGDRSLAQNVRISLLEAIGGPTEELLRGIELLRRDSDQPQDPKSHLIILESLTDPVDEILVSLSRIEHELSSRESYESDPVGLEKPIALERMCIAVSRLGTNVRDISKRDLLFGDESTSCSVIERLQSVYQSLDAFLSTVPLSDVSGALENNVDTLVVETLVRPLEELSKNLVIFSTSNLQQLSERDDIVAGVEKSMSEMRTRLEALIIALDTYEKESGEQGITELHEDLVKFLRYTMDDAIERLEKLKVKKNRVTQESRTEPEVRTALKSRQDSDVEELTTETIVEQSNVLQNLVKEAAGIMNIVAVPSIVEAQIRETESQVLEAKSKTSETVGVQSTDTEEEPPVKTDRKKKSKKQNSSEKTGEASFLPKTPGRIARELDLDLSLPEMLLDPLIDVQANLSDVISDFESQESAEESSLPVSSELAACLTELRECVATAVHTATTLKSENTVNALVDLREPLLDLQLAMASAVSPDELKLIREATIPLAELKVIVAAAMVSPQASEASQMQMKPVLRMLEDIEADLAQVSRPESNRETAATSSTISEAKETKSIPKRPPEEVERAAVALTGVHFALSTALDRALPSEDEAVDSSSPSKQEGNPLTARYIAEQSATSDLIASIEELRQSVGSLAVAIGTPVASSDSNDQYSYDILFDELAKLEEPLLNLQKVLLTEVHGPEDRHVLNDVASPLRSLKEVIQDVTREIGGGSTPIILELIEDVEKDVSLVAMEALKKALARKSVTSDDDGMASVSSDFKPGEVPVIISKWLDPIENWLTSTTDEAGEIDKEQTTASIAPVIDDLKRELLKIAIQTSYSEPPSDIALIESLTELQEPLARVREVLAECHDPDSLSIVEGLIQPTKHLMGTILDASMTHEAGRVLRPVLEAIEELENQIPLTVKRINYERELQRVVRSLTPEEPETLIADEIGENLDEASAKITAIVEVHESSEESSRKIAIDASQVDVGSVQSHQVPASEDSSALLATVERLTMDESRHEQTQATEGSVEKEKSIDNVEVLAQTDAADRESEVIMTGNDPALPEGDFATLQAKSESKETKGLEEQVEAISAAKEDAKVEKELESTSEASIKLEETVGETNQAFPTKDSTAILAIAENLENIQDNTQGLTEVVEVKASKEKAKLSRQVATAGSQLEDSLNENIQTLTRELPVLDQANIGSLEGDDYTKHAEGTEVLGDQQQSDKTLDSYSIVAAPTSELEVTMQEITQALSQEPSAVLQVQAESSQTNKSNDQGEPIEAIAMQDVLEENPETSNQAIIAASELEASMEENIQTISQENASSAQAKSDASETYLLQEPAESSEIAVKTDELDEMSKNLARHNTIELITVDGRPFVEEVTSLEPQRATETTVEHTNRAEQLDLWTLTLLGPLECLGDAVLSLDRSLDDEAHVLLCRPLDSLYKQIESAVSQFNRSAGQSPENDVETIIEGFLSPVNQLHSALSSAVVVWEVEEPRPVIPELLRTFADSSTELCELLNALRVKLYPQIQRSAQSRQEQQEDASLAETITAVLTPLDNLRNLIETTLKSPKFMELGQIAMKDKSPEDLSHVDGENMATAQEICHQEEIIQEQDDSMAGSLERKAHSREENELSEASVNRPETIAATMEENKDLEIASADDVGLTELATLTEVTESSVQERASTSKPEAAKLLKRASKGKEDSMDIEEKTAKPLEELIEAIVDSSGPRNVPSSSEGFQSMTPDVSDDNLDKAEILTVEKSIDPQVGAVGLTGVISTDHVPVENFGEMEIQRLKEDMANVLVDGILAEAETATGVKVFKDIEQSHAEKVSTDSLVAGSINKIGLASQMEDITEGCSQDSRAGTQLMEGLTRVEDARHAVTENISQSAEAQLPKISQTDAKVQALEQAKAAELNVQEGNLIKAGFDDLQMEQASLVTQQSLAVAEKGKLESPILGSPAISHENIPIETVEDILAERSEKLKAESLDHESVARVNVTDSPEIMVKTRTVEVTETSEVLEEDVTLRTSDASKEQEAKLHESNNLARADVRDVPETKIHGTDIDTAEAQENVLGECAQDHSTEGMQRKDQLREAQSLVTATGAEASRIETSTKDLDIMKTLELSETGIEEIAITKLDEQKTELHEVEHSPHVLSGVTKGMEVKIEPVDAVVSETSEAPEETSEEIAGHEFKKYEAIISEGESLASANLTESLETKMKPIDAKISETSELPEEHVKEFVPETSNEQTAASLEAVSLGKADVIDSPDVEISAKEAEVSTVIQHPESRVEEFVKTSNDEETAKISHDDSMAEVHVTDAPEINIKTTDAHILEPSTDLQETIQEIAKQETSIVKAIASVEELHTGQIAKIEAAETAKYGKEDIIGAADSEIVEIIETPTQKIFRVKELGTKNGEPDRILERAIVKPVEEVIAMEDQHIIETIETPTEKLIKIKVASENKDGDIEEVIQEIVVKKPVEGWTRTLVEEEERAISVSHERVQEFASGKVLEILHVAEEEQQQSIDEHSEGRTDKSADARTDQTDLTLEKEHDRSVRQEDEANVKTEGQQIDRSRMEKAVELDGHGQAQQKADLLQQDESGSSKKGRDEGPLTMGDEKIDKDKLDDFGDAKQETERLSREKSGGSELEEVEPLGDEKMERTESEKMERLKHEEAERLEREEKERLECEEARRLERENIERLEREEIERLEREELKRLEREEIERLEREEIERLRREEIERLEHEEMERLKREQIERLEREEIERLEREKIERLERETIERLEREKIERLEREEIERLEREEIERLEREKAERLEREEIERREREDEERVKREEAERSEREEKKRLEREEAERLEREETKRLEREELERLEHEEAERLKRVEEERMRKLEAERLEKEEFDRREKAREEAERLKLEEMERQRIEQEEKLHREEAEKLIQEERKRQEELEIERLKKQEETERLETEERERREKLEAEQLKKEEEERLRKVEAERLEAEERERDEKLKAEQLKKEEDERVRKEECEKIEKEEREREEKAKQELERLEKEEFERKTQETERLKREQLERERREEEERLEREEMERLKEEELEHTKRIEEERLNKEEAERLKQEELERIEKEEEERMKKQEAEKLKEEELERTRKEEEEEERLKKEEKKRKKKEAERLKQEELERAKQEEEEERLKKEEAERLKKEEVERAKKEEEDRLKKEEAKRLELVELERIKKEEEEETKRQEVERLEHEELERAKEEEERQKKEEADRLKQEELERAKREEEEERLKKEEAERLKKEEVERAKKEEEDRLKKEEAKRLELVELERIKKEEEEQTKRQEVERLKQEELDRAKEEEERQKEMEAERVKQEELERAKKQEEERLKKEEAEQLERAERERIKIEEEEQMKRREAERIEQEEIKRAKEEEEERNKKEAERVRQEELERAKKEEEEERIKKEEAERLKKEEIERAKKEKEEEERIKKEEAERLKKEEIERAKKEEIERAKKEEEEERIKKEETERLKKEEIERAKKEEEDNRLKKEEAERLKREELESANKKEEERIQQEEAAELERKTLEKQEAAKLEEEKLAKEKAARLETKKLKKKEEAKLEKEKLEKEEAARLNEEKMKKEAAAKFDKEKLEKEEAARLEIEKLEKEEAAKLEKKNQEKEEAAAATLETEKLVKDEATKLEKEKLKKEEATKPKTVKLGKEEVDELAKEKLEKSKEETERADKKEIERVKKEKEEQPKTKKTEKLDKGKSRRKSEEAARMKNEELDDKPKNVTKDDLKNERDVRSKEDPEKSATEATPKINEAESERLEKKDSKLQHKEENAKRSKKAESKEKTETISKKSDNQEIVNVKSKDGAQSFTATNDDDSDDEKTPMNSEREFATYKNKRRGKFREDDGFDRESGSISTIGTDSEIDSTYSESANLAVSRDEAITSKRRRKRSIEHGIAIEVSDTDFPKERSDRRANDRTIINRTRGDDTLSSDDRHYTGYYSGTGRTHEFGPGPRDRGKKPSFCTKLTDRTAAEASRIKLTCTVLGEPEPQVHWTKNGVRLPISSNRHCTTEDNGMVTIEFYAATPKDSGEYSCVAMNLHGQAHTEAKLKVYPGYEPAPAVPTFTRPIKDTYRSVENELVLECRVRGQPSPKITWLKDGQNLDMGDRYRQCDLGDGLCRLKILNPDFYDSGLYTCKAENSSKISDRTSHVVNFEGKGKEHSWRGSYRNLTSTDVDTGRPRFSSYLTDHSVPAGGTIALQVEVKGVPPPDITWMRGDKGEPIPSYKARTFADSGIYTLIVPEATESETGTYVCRASNAYGYVDTTANVQVISSGSIEGGKSAIFVSRPAETMIHVTVGEDVSVSFRVNGVPKPRIVWMKGMRDISNGPRSYKESIDDYVRLTLKRALVSDEGTYCILAKNRYGCDRTFYTVKVKQRARSLTPSPDWGSVDTDNLLATIHDTERSYLKQVPGPISSEPVVVDGGRNWLALSWGKPVQHGPAPVVAYRVDAWLLGGEGGARWSELGITPVNAYDAFNLRPGGEYKFRITPRNRYGWGESLTMTGSATVREIAKFPEFSKILPGQLKALRGETLHLECEVRSESKAEVKWYRDTTDIDGIDDPRYMTYFNGRKSSLTVQAIKERDSGRFVCEAVNPAGRVSTFARVQVVTDSKIVEADEKLRRMRTLEPNNGERPPEFTMRLRDRRVQMTYPVRLTCQVSGHPEPDVTWYKNREEIYQDENTSFWDDESHFHTLEISHSTLDDSGIYMAKARNVNGMVSCRCHLVVDKGIRAYVAPEFYRHLDAVYTVKAGGELRMSAQIEAYPTVGVVWHRDGHRLRPSRSAVMTLNHDGSVELSLAHVTPRDAGVYCCTATNEVGRTESATRVTVLGAADEEPPSHSQSLPDVVESLDVPYSKEPLFVTKPLSTEAVEGDTVIILCEVVGDPKPEVIWLRDFLRPDYYRDAAHFRRVGAGPQYRLEIPYAKLDFTGAYTVIAKNCHGETKAIISLQIYARGQGKIDGGMEQATIKHGNVQTLPSIRRPLRDLRCCDGDAVTLICRVHATPEPDVRWEKGGKLVSLGEDFAADFDGETARLSIQHVYPEDEGEYTCVAYNDLGKAFTSACLIVDVPEGKESALSRTLIRPMGLLSAESTPISTPRSTPVRSLSPSCVTSRRELKPAGRSSRGQTINRRPRLPTGPKFYAVPHNRVAEEGETVRFQCAVAGHPTPWVTWDKDGVSVTPTARITLKEKDDVRILEIVEITHDDAGLYRITLENDVGRTEATARLEIIKGRHSSVTRSIRTRSASPRTYSIYSRSPITSAPRGDTHLRPNLYDPMRGRGGTVSPTLPRWHQRNGKPHAESPEPARRTNKRTTPTARTTLKNGIANATKSQNPKLSISTRPRSSSVPKHNRDLRVPEFAPANSHPTEQTKTTNALKAANESKIRPNQSSTTRESKPSTTRGSIHPTRLPISRSRSPKVSTKRSTDSPIKSEDPSNPIESTNIALSFINNEKPLVTPKTAETIEPPTRNNIDEEPSKTTIPPNDEISPPPKSHEIPMEHSKNDDDDTRKPRAPVIIAAPADVIALRGAKVILLATFDSEPQPRVRWLRKGRDVKFDAKAEIVTNQGLTCLTLESVTTDQAGKYAVTLENSVGRDCRYVNVTVEGVPDPPAGSPCVQSITRAGKAIVTWRSPAYDGGCAVTGYSVEMNRSEEPCWIAVAEARHSLSHTVTGLEPEETYRFRVRAENAHGVSEPGVVSEPITVPGENDEEIGGQVFVAEINQIENEEEDEEFTPSFEARTVSFEEGPKFEERYDVREELGKGRYGIVRRIVEKSSGLNLAAKFVRTIKSKDRQQVNEEIGIMNILRHPKLLRLAAAFESPKEMIMVTEYISGGELFERVVADDFTLTEKDSIQFVKQICEGVKYMHAQRVVHLDLKPENIMCHDRTSHRIKLIDFGLAQYLKPDTPVRVLLGTPEFIPPEIIGFEPIGTESDMWSVGVICYVLLTGLSPFMGDNDAETFANITRADYDFDDKAFAAISQEAKDFISALLVKRKESRMSANQCLEHPWLAQRAESMSRIALPTEKLKKFIVRRKWQKTGNAIRALGRMATLSANSRKNLSSESSPTKTDFEDELFEDATANVHGFKPIKSSIVVDDRTAVNHLEERRETVLDEKKLTDSNDDVFLITNEEPIERESQSKTNETSIDKKISNGLEIEKTSPTTTELETTEISNEHKVKNDPQSVREIDDSTSIEANEKSVNSTTESSNKESPKEIPNDNHMWRNKHSKMIGTSYYDEAMRKFSFSSFVNLEIDETGTIEILENPSEKSDDNIRTTKSKEIVDDATTNEEINYETKISQNSELDEIIEPEVCEEKIVDGTRDKENADCKKDELRTAVCNERIIDDRGTKGRSSIEKNSVVNKVWCRNNSPVLVDEEDEDARLTERVRTRHIVCTGAVSRTAKMFEREEKANSLPLRSQQTPIRTTSTVPEARPQNERIRKAFAFWNQ